MTNKDKSTDILGSIIGSFIGTLIGNWMIEKINKTNK